MTNQAPTDPRPDIKSLPLPRLVELARGWGQPEFRGRQLYNWLYHKAARDFASMSDLPAAMRQRLEEEYRLGFMEPARTQVSRDGTHKFLFRLDDGEKIETVLIPEADHWTLCLSSQVGCAMGCKFCHTGAGGLRRNLLPAEIIGQIQTAQALAPTGQPFGPMPVSNLVFMGMGEPLANLDNLIAALRIVTDPAGLALAWRHVTVSTAGLVEQMPRLTAAARVRLAVSLNAPDDDLRSELMPINRRHPLKELMAACRALKLRRGERITFEYILMAGVNDQPDHAKALVRLLSQLPAKINLIPFNEHPASPFRRPGQAAVEAFQRRLLHANLTAFVRRSMGADILAACGQLRGQE